MRVATTPKAKVTTAHRMSYALFVGHIPEGMAVMHMCDNRACFNPDHLKLGTLADNNRDMMQKGRAAWQNMNWGLVMAKNWVARKARVNQDNAIQISPSN